MGTNGNRVLIVGGGIAALEALLALRDQTEGVAEVTLLSPADEFVYRPNLVFEPFSSEVAERHDLAAILEECGGTFVHDRLVGIDPDAGVARTSESGQIEFDHALIAIGAHTQPAIASAETLWIGSVATRIEEILDRAADAGSLDLLAPAGVIWTLPLYEFALMARRRITERGEATAIRVFTPEAAPLSLFGAAASSEVEALLEARHVVTIASTWISELGDGTLSTSYGTPEIGACRVALPEMVGIPIPGLPADRNGFIPIDQFARVRGHDNTYAAGDGTDFPVKQGGIATQQADAAAAHISAKIMGRPTPDPLRLILRGKLVTGTETLNMRTPLTGGAGEGAVSSDYLWWPPHKVSGHYLAPWLARESVHSEAEPPARTTEVEISLPHEWHPEPMHGAAPREGL